MDETSIMGSNSMYKRYTWKALALDMNVSTTRNESVYYLVTRKNGVYTVCIECDMFVEWVGHV